MKKFLVILAAVWGLTLGFQSTSHAMTLAFYDFNTNTATWVYDDDSLDSSAGLGVITFNGAIGTWNINVTTAISKNIVGSASDPHIHLNSVNLTSAVGGNLRIGVVDSGFTGPISGGFGGPFALSAGGTTDGSITFRAVGDDNNLEDFTWTSIFPFAQLGPFTGPAYSGTTTGTFPAANPYSLLLLADITHTDAAISSFDVDLRAVPEPTTMLLFGLGLLGLAGLRRKFKK